MNGKLYSVWTDDEMSPVFNVYQDDTEALIAFRNLILAIRKDIDSGALETGIDARLSLKCHGFLTDGVIYGLIEPIHLMLGGAIPDEVESGDDITLPVSHLEVSE